MITIVISSFYYGHLAAHCIESILSQTKKPERILFVDDGAGDCHHLQKIYPEIEYVLRNENLGVLDNFNDMLYRVNSNYVMFIGADNWLRSDAVEFFEYAISKASPDVITYDIMITGEIRKDFVKKLKDIKQELGDYYWTRNGHHGSMLYRTSLGQEIGYKKYRDDSPRPEEDWNLWDEMVKRKAKIVRIPEALLYYRRHRENFLKY